VDVNVNGVLRMACIDAALRRQQQLPFKGSNSAEIRRIVVNRVYLAALAASQQSGMMPGEGCNVSCPWPIGNGTTNRGNMSSHSLILVPSDHRWKLPIT
jgi:hypothetical protein